MEVRADDDEKKRGMAEWPNPSPECGLARETDDRVAGPVIGSRLEALGTARLREAVLQFNNEYCIF